MEPGIKSILKDEKEDLIVEYFWRETVSEQSFLSAVILYNSGVRCGYIGINRRYIPSLKKLSIFPKNYSTDVDLNCHGGITYHEKYSTFIRKENIQQFNEYRWIGYDCGHIQDRRDFDKVEKIWPNSYYIYNRSQLSFWERGQLRTTNYCIEQNRHLIGQLYFALKSQ